MNCTADLLDILSHKGSLRGLSYNFEYRYLIRAWMKTGTVANYWMSQSILIPRTIGLSNRSKIFDSSQLGQNLQNPAAPDCSGTCRSRSLTSRISCVAVIPMSPSRQLSSGFQSQPRAAVRHTGPYRVLITGSTKGKERDCVDAVWTRR